jgi:hypothetical protein
MHCHAFICSRVLRATLHYGRAQLQCRAAASGYPAQLAVPDGEFKIPLITDIANTYEWLTDYEAFYKKRCACTPPKRILNRWADVSPDLAVRRPYP